MNKPRITWFVKEDGGYVPKQEHHAGTYTPDNPIVLHLQVWNNRWGTEDVETIENPVLNFYFDTFEDKSLLERCKITFDEINLAPLIIKGEKATAIIGRPLSGKKNNGDEESVANRDNFIDIKFEFRADGYRLKENDLKNIYFEIVPMN